MNHSYTLQCPKIKIIFPCSPIFRMAGGQDLGWIWLGFTLHFRLSLELCYMLLFLISCTPLLSHWQVNRGRWNLLRGILDYSLHHQKWILEVADVIFFQRCGNICIILPEHFPSISTLSFTISLYVSYAFARRRYTKQDCLSWDTW